MKLRCNIEQNRHDQTEKEIHILIMTNMYLIKLNVKANGHPK